MKGEINIELVISRKTSIMISRRTVTLSQEKYKDSNFSKQKSFRYTISEFKHVNAEERPLPFHLMTEEDSGKYEQSHILLAWMAANGI